MLRNSCGIHMSVHPSGGQGRLCKTSQMPERSGLPSRVRRAGAERFGLPSGVRGIPAVGYCTHWACEFTAAMAAAAIKPAMILFTDKVIVILVVLVANIFQKLGVRNQAHIFLHRPRFGVRLGIVDGQQNIHVPEIAAME